MFYITKEIEKYLNAEDIAYTKFNNNISFFVETVSRSYMMQFIIFEGMERLTLLANLSTSVPENKTTDVIEFIVRFNDLLRAGNLRMSIEDGVVQFMLTNLVDGSLSFEIMDRIIEEAITAMKIVETAFLAVLEYNVNPAKAFNIKKAQLENEDSDEDSVAGEVPYETYDGFYL